MITTKIFFAAVFVLFCAFMLRHAILGYRRALASDRWPTIDGVLANVHLWGKRNIDGEMVDAEKLSVKYEYEILGVQYSGSQVSFYQLHYPETIEFANAHPENTLIKVSYNPEDPTKSVLISGLHPTKPYSGLILAVSGLIISIAIFIAAWLGVL